MATTLWYRMQKSQFKMGELLFSTWWNIGTLQSYSHPSVFVLPVVVVVDGVLVDLAFVVVVVVVVVAVVGSLVVVVAVVGGLVVVVVMVGRTHPLMLFAKRTNKA